MATYKNIDLDVSMSNIRARMDALNPLLRQHNLPKIESELRKIHEECTHALTITQSLNVEPVQQTPRFTGFRTGAML